MRHLNVIGLTTFDDESMSKIYQTILGWFLSTRNFTAEIQKLSPVLISATINLYNWACKNLLPTPKKSHYVFNLRDISRVIKGLLLSSSAKFAEVDKVQRLWVHESYRVFYDRLMEDSDRALFFAQISEIVEKTIGVKMVTLYKRLDPKPSGVDDQDMRKVMFGDFVDPGAAGSKLYDELVDLDKVSLVLRSKLEDYNSLSKAPMNLVIFRFAGNFLISSGYSLLINYCF